MFKAAEVHADHRFCKVAFKLNSGSDTRNVARKEKA